jgi:cell wall-associated NlpC family hydrolase
MRIGLARAKRWIGAHGHWRHLCLAFVRTRYELPKRQHTAIRAWSAARHKHRHDRYPPAGVPVFWSGGSHRHGHVAISLGHGMIISTDLPRTGHVTRTRLSTVERRWGLHYLGWTEDLEGVRIYRR